MIERAWVLVIIGISGWSGSGASTYFVDPVAVVSVVAWGNLQHFARPQLSELRLGNMIELNQRVDARADFFATESSVSPATIV